MVEHSSRTADVLVIGGGIIGCSIAWRLAKAGAKVTVLDRSEPGSEASSAAAGMLAPVGEMIEPETFSALCVSSRSLYPRFAAEVEECSGHQVGYRRDGSLLVALDEDQEQELRKIQIAQGAQGFQLQWLTSAEVQERQAGLSAQVRAGLFIPGDHWIDNECLMRMLVMVCQRAGVRIEPGCAVQEIRRNGDRIEGIRAANGSSFAARTYVLAAGSWSGEIASGLGLSVPVVPCCGQMMEFESPRDLRCVVRAGMHYLVPRPGRRVVVGTTAEYTGFAKTVTAQGLLSILHGAVGLAPMFHEFRFLRAWAGLRPDTVDHLPILGYGEIENLVFATGHFRNGILLAPVTAEIVEDLILKGSTSRPIEPYRPTRFSHGAA